MTRRTLALAALFGLACAGAATGQTFGPSSSRKASPDSQPQLQTTTPQGQPRSASFAACSAAYHKALEPLRTGRGAALSNLPRALRAPDPELPGKWQIAAPASGKPKPPPKPERICAETKDVPGKAPRCVRYETKQPVIPPEVVARTSPSAEEARVLKPIGDFIEAKGGLPDVGPNGRHYGVLARMTQEVRQYVMQEEHPSLCAGAVDLIDFYSTQVSPLKRRVDEVATLAKLAKDQSEQRVRAIAVVEQRVYDRAVADAAKVEEQRTRLLDAHKAAVAKALEAAKEAATKAQESTSGASPPALPAEPKLPDVPALPARPNAPAKPEDYAIIGLPSLMSEALRPLLPREKVAEIVDEKTPVKMFVKARATLLDPATPAPTAHADVREAALMALRLLEARVYGELYVTRMKDLDAPLFGSLADLRQAQKSSCTCQE